MDIHIIISQTTDIVMQATLHIQNLPGSNLGPGGENTIVTNLLNTVYFFAGAAAVIAIIVGGFMYITGGDNPSQVQRGKNSIIYASVGLIVVFLAFGITGFVAERF